MAGWCIVITGEGDFGHDSPIDADVIGAAAVAELKARGQDVTHASFTREAETNPDELVTTSIDFDTTAPESGA